MKIKVKLRTPKTCFEGRIFCAFGCNKNYIDVLSLNVILDKLNFFVLVINFLETKIHSIVLADLVYSNCIFVY